MIIRKVMLLLTVYFFSSLTFADNNGFNFLSISNNPYTYDGGTLAVTIKVSRLKEDYEGLDLNLESIFDFQYFDVVSDDSSSSVLKIAAHNFKIHFNLKNNIKIIQNGSNDSSHSKEVKFTFKILPHAGFSYSINCTAALLGSNKKTETVIYGPSRFSFYNLDPSFKGFFEKALVDAREEVWNNILKTMWLDKKNLNLAFIKENYPLKNFDVLVGNLKGKGNDQLILNLGSYLGMGGSKYGVFVFDFDKTGYKKIFSKLGYEVSTQVITWSGKTGLLVWDSEYDGKDSNAQLLLYKDGQIVPVLDYAFSNCIVHVGCSFRTFLDDRNNKLYLYKMNGQNDGDGHIGCYSIKKQPLLWDEKNFKFDPGAETIVSKEDLDSLKKSYANSANDLAWIEICPNGK